MVEVAIWLSVEVETEAVGRGVNDAWRGREVWTAMSEVAGKRHRWTVWVERVFTGTIWWTAL